MRLMELFMQFFSVAIKEEGIDLLSSATLSQIGITSESINVKSRILKRKLFIYSCSINALLKNAIYLGEVEMFFKRELYFHRSLQKKCLTNPRYEALLHYFSADLSPFFLLGVLNDCFAVIRANFVLFV